MAFKSVEQFNEDRYGNMFRLVNDKETADVVFLYQSMKDMLVADVHYIKSNDPTASGYVHCCGGNTCPACGKGIRIQTKLFIPLYNIKKDAIEFWDRTMRFEPQFEKDVFQKFPNPSEYVFRVTRNGVPNDVNTYYTIEAVGKNSSPSMSFASILAKFNAKMPDYYENIVKTVDEAKLSQILAQDSEPSVNQEYVPVPRAGYQSSIPDTFVNASEAVNVPSETPTSADTNDEGGDTLPDPIF